MSTGALQSRVEVLRSTTRFPDEVITRFVRFLQEAPDPALFRMSPVRYAPEVGIPEQQAIDLFLHATRAGLVDFTWGLLCPACHGFLTTEGALKALASARHCSLCDVKVEVDDDSLEVAFTVNPAVRKIRFHQPETVDFKQDALRLFFSTSLTWGAAVERSLPERTLASGVLPANGSASFEVQLSPGYYSLVVPSHHAWARIAVDPEGPAELPLEITDGAALPRLNTARAGMVKLTLRSRIGRPAVYGLIAMPQTIDKWLGPYLTGKRLVTTQAFRDLFRTESIPAAGGLQLKNVTLLFTDLKGSTEMYERIGDLRAFSLVREHFGLLQDIIAERGGAMVKTIGDAIMATFAEPEPALEAAIAMKRDIRRVGQPGELQLKIGMHSGPCIAVEQNERLDYFGQTVNIAARVQAVAAANEIAVTEPVFQAPRTQAIVKESALSLRTSRELLKGVDAAVTVHHLS